MTRLPYLFSALLLGLAISCASDDDDGDDTNNTGNTAAMTTMSEETGEEVCDSSHQCINDVCSCTTPGKEMQPCDDDMACEAQCEVCM